MKCFKKSVSIITLIFIMCNFFVAPMSVYAESSVIAGYINDIASTSSNISAQILTSKNSTEYLNNADYKYAVDCLYEDYVSLSDEYNSYKNNLGTLLSLRQILTDSSSSLINIYNEKFTEDVIVNIEEEIADITYEDPILGDVVLITGADLVDLIYNTYFKSYDDKFDAMNTGYSTLIEGHKSFYLTSYGHYETAKNTITGYINDINLYIDGETNLGNNPNVIHEGSNVIDKLNGYVTDLDSVLETVLSNRVYNNDFDSIVSNALTIRNAFDANNKNITTEIVGDIESLTTVYENYKNELNALFVGIGTTFDNTDYSLVQNIDTAKLNEFLLAFEKSYDNDSDYDLLIDKVNTYLERKQSERSNIELYLNELNNLYNELNQNKILSIYNNFVYNADVSNEDNVDLLLGYKGLTTSSEEYKYLKDVKNSFYPVGALDESIYSVETFDDYLVVYGVNNLDKTIFENNLDYAYDFTLETSKSIIDSSAKLKLKDRDGEFLRTLSILIKNDINGDGVLSNEDVLSLKDKVLTNNFSDLDKLISDVNNDGKYNINDVTMLNSMVNNSNDVSSTTDASFRVMVNETDNNVIYNVYLVTDGMVSGFEFDVAFSNNLKFISANAASGVSYLDNVNKIRVVGLGNYYNENLILSINFEKDTTSTEDINLSINSGVIVFDNSNFKDNLSYQNTIKYTEESIVVTTISNDVIDDTNKVEETKDSVVLKDVKDVKTPKESKISEKELDEKDVVWGNVIKVAILVLLGALIIYFLNKDAEVNFDLEKENNDKKEEKNKDSEK